MTEPTDDELDALCAEISDYDDPAYFRAMARAVLAKWGTPAGVGEPSGRVVSANCEYATVQWLRQTSDVGSGDPKNSRSWPITGDAVYLTPQPTQAQAGAVPLTPEQITAAAKKLAECMDYPWDHMPEQGRAEMRKHAQAVIAAANGSPPPPPTA